MEERQPHLSALGQPTQLGQHLPQACLIKKRTNLVTWRGQALGFTDIQRTLHCGLAQKVTPACPSHRSTPTCADTSLTAPQHAVMCNSNHSLALNAFYMWGKGPLLTLNGESRNTLHAERSTHMSLLLKREAVLQRERAAIKAVCGKRVQVSPQACHSGTHGQRNSG